MKKQHVLLLIFLCLLGARAYAQGFANIGDVLVNDVGNRLLFSSDGTFITIGTKAAAGVIYKTDCSGAIVAQAEKSVSPISTTFWDAVELNDGSIVAVGSAFIPTPTDTTEQVIVWKLNAGLVETGFSAFKIQNKAARAKSIALSKTGHLLVLGEVTGVSIDFTDMFFQRVSPATLAPTATPVIYNNGVDHAERIVPTADDQFVIASSSFLGNIFDTSALITNRLLAIKVNDLGVIQWQYQYQQIFKAAYGVSRAAGLQQNPVTGNLMYAGTTNVGGGTSGLDPVMILLSDSGVALDTVVEALFYKQRFYNIFAYSQLPGLFTAIGGSDNPNVGVPNLFAYQAYEYDNTILQTQVIEDQTNYLTIIDAVEFSPNRFAFMGITPDNPFVLGSKNIAVVTPELEVAAAYEDCKLIASSPDIDLNYQWYFEGAPVAGASGAEYAPSISGNYYAVVTDAAGCSSISDTVAVSVLTADFGWTSNNLTVTFADSSQEVDSYMWQFGDGATSTLINPQHTYSAPGTYFVILTVSNGCGVSTSTQTVVLTSPSSEPDWLQQCQVSPNPTTGQFVVTLQGRPEAQIELALMNTLGQLMRTEILDFSSGKLNQTMDISALPQGIYNVRIRAGQSSRYVKLIRL